MNAETSDDWNARKCKLTVIGSSTSSMPILFTNMSPYSPMHQTATRTKLSWIKLYYKSINDMNMWILKIDCELGINPIERKHGSPDQLMFGMLCIKP